MKTERYQWAARGDVNAFFGLMLDNVAGLVLTVVLLASVFGFPVDFAIKYMVPGTAIGVLVGDLLYFWLAFRLSRQTGRRDVTAMPLGLDTPSTIGMVLFVIGPAFVAAKAELGVSGELTPEEISSAAANRAWHIGICAIVATGFIKLVLAAGSNWIRKVFPRAGLLGSLAAIALVLIAFMQMPKLAANPMVGFAALSIVLVTLIARCRLPFNFPGAAAAVIVGCVIWYMLLLVQEVSGATIVNASESSSRVVWFPIEWLTVFRFEWLSAFEATLPYMAYIIPFAIATVIGGIDCTESAASAGDDYETRNIIGVEAIATLAAGFCGGVVQTTPYIGHPAYKSMGGRAAYTLATALFIGGAGLVGYFSLIFKLIPEAAMLPILIFIGIEITAQSFHATPRRHYAAIAIAFIPALAKLVMIHLGQFLSFVDFESMDEDTRTNLENTILFLSVMAGGFILTSLIWASALARIIDRRFFSASAYFAVGGILVLFGVMHSPLAGDQMFWPWQISGLDAANRKIIVDFAMAYLLVSVMLFGLGWLMRDEKNIQSDEEFEALL